jgi:transposase
MAIVAHSRPFVIGVDTHARNHALSILACPQGELVDEGQFPTTTAGLCTGCRRGPRAAPAATPAVLWVIEGTGTYGARLARAVADAGYEVVEAPTDERPRRPRHRQVRPAGRPPHRRSSPPAAGHSNCATRGRRRGPGRCPVLLASRDHMSTERTATINALTALLRVADLGIDARRPLTGAQITTVAGWRTREEPLAVSTARWEAARLAKRVAALDDELKDITKRISDLLHQSPASVLLEQPGIGPITAAVALTAWSHLGRIRSESAFASLAGVNPIPASSGNTVRHRINRGGDRRLNRALHMAVVTRMRMDPRTRAYVERRSAEGRTLREIRRSLKRYLAREIYRRLNATAQLDQAAA